MNMKTIEMYLFTCAEYLQRRKTINPNFVKLARATSNEKLSQAFHARLETPWTD